MPEINNTWFIKFDLDDGTQDVCLHLRQRQLKGQPVNASIKSEHFLRSFFPVQQHNVMPAWAPQYDVQYDPSQYDGMTGGVIMPPQNLPGPAVVPLASPVQGMMAGMPMRSPQKPGFWQPWGLRLQAAPLIFTGDLTGFSKSAGSYAVPHYYQASECGKDAKGKGKDPKGQKGYGKENNEYSYTGKGKDGKEAKGYDNTCTGKGKGKGKDGKDSSSGMGKQGDAASSSWHDADGWDEPGRGKRKGDKTDNSTNKAEKGVGKQERVGNSKTKWMPVKETVHTPAVPGSAIPSTYDREFRKYTRDQFLQFSLTVKQEQLSWPKEFEQLRAEVPIFRETACVELATG